VLLGRAEQALLAGELQDAEDKFRAILDREPTSFAALVGAGHAARRQRKYPSALDYFQRAAAAIPGHDGARIEVAGILAELGRLDAAESIYRRILEHDPKHFGALVGLGHAARKRGDRQDSARHFELAVRAAPDHIGALAELATDYRELCQCEAAESVYRRILKLDPGNVAALAGWAQTERQRGRPRQALRRLKAARRAAPGNSFLLAEIAGELLALSQDTEAKAIYEELRNQQADSLPALMGLGYIARRCSDHAAARDLYREAVARHPDSAQALVELAVEERALGDLPQSNATLEAARGIAPDDMGVLLHLAENALLAEDCDGAQAFAERAMAAHATEVAPSLLAARVLHRRGSPEEALDVLERAQRAHGARPEILAGRLELLRNLGRWNEATAIARSRASRQPDHFWLWLQIVLLHLDRGNFTTVQWMLDRAPRTTLADGALVWMARGRLAEARHQTEEAARYYDRALEANPDDQWRHIDSARVALLNLKLDTASSHLRSFATASAVARPGRFVSPSQSQLGQVLDEYRLDAPLADELAALRSFALPKRLSRLRALARENPDSTVAAIELVLALRDACLPPTASKSSTPIPAQIFQYWDERVPPADVRAVMGSWTHHNPGFRYRLFDDESARGYLCTKYSKEVLRAYQRATHPAQRADLFRLAILREEGGIYADADDRCIAPLRPLIESAASLVAYREEYGTLGNNFLCCVPGHLVIEHALSLCVEALNRGDHDVPWLATGPALITRAIAQIVARDGSSWKARLKQITVLERFELHRFVVPHQPLRYKNTPRHWIRSSFQRDKAASLFARRSRSIPTYATLLNKQVIRPLEGDYIAVDKGFLGDSLEPLLSRIYVDSPWYLRQYPDVEAAIAAGRVSGALEHYARFGFYEHRRPYAIVVDEPWYLKAYADVAQAIRLQQFSSGQEHFDAVGYREGRLPFENFTLRLANEPPEP